MKIAGIVGGIAPESTIDYYRQIIKAYREHDTSGNNPEIIINSINLRKMLDMIGANELPAVIDYLLAALEKLARAGVDFAAFASNTPHLVFNEVRARSPVPLISIVVETRTEAERRGLKKVGLFGTRFTMQATFYKDVFSRLGIDVIAPNQSEQDYIHDHYMNELVNGVYLPETRARLLEIVEQLKERTQIDGLILGGTELPLLLREERHNGIPFLDTTKIHVKRILAELVA